MYEFNEMISMKELKMIIDNINIDQDVITLLKSNNVKSINKAINSLLNDYIKLPTDLRINLITERNLNFGIINGEIYYNIINPMYGGILIVTDAEKYDNNFVSNLIHQVCHVILKMMYPFKYDSLLEYPSIYNKYNHDNNFNYLYKSLCKKIEIKNNKE